MSQSTPAPPSLSNLSFSFKDLSNKPLHLLILLCLLVCIVWMIIDYFSGTSLLTTKTTITVMPQTTPPVSTVQLTPQQQQAAHKKFNVLVQHPKSPSVHSSLSSHSSLQAQSSNPSMMASPEFHAYRHTPENFM